MSQTETRTKQPTWVWAVIGGMGIMFLLLCGGISVLLVQNSPAFYATPSASTNSLQWLVLPAPRVTAPNWASFTSVSSVRDVLVTGDLRWIGTDGGLLVLDTVSGETVHFASEHGLPSNRVTGVALGRDGVIWVGTDHGIGRYDGRQWRTYTAEDGLPSSEISQIGVGRDGVVWAGTPLGLARFEGDNWRPVRFHLLDFAPVEIQDLHLASNGQVWVAVSDGVWRLTEESWQKFTRSDGLVNPDIRDLTETPDGRLWGATPSGLLMVDDTDRWSWYTVKEGLRDLPIAQIGAAGDNTIFVSYEQDNKILGEVDRFDGIGASPASLDLAGQSLQFVSRKQGRVWIGTSAGLWEHDGDWASVHWPETFPSTQIYDLLEDGDDLWLAGSAGISHWNQDDDQWETEPIGDVRALVRGDDQIWAALRSPADGLRYFDPVTESWQEVACETAGVEFEHIIDGGLGPDGRVWFVGGTGAAAYDPETLRWTHFTTDWPSEMKHVRQMAIDSAGSVWVGLFEGLYRLDETSGRWILELSQEIRRLAVTPSGAFWLVTDQGLFHWIDGELIRVPYLSTVEYTDGFMATDEALWVTTSSGVARLQDGEWRLFGVEDGLAIADTSTLITGPNGRVWVGYGNSRTGFSVFNEETDRWDIVHNVVDPDAPNNGHPSTFQPRRDAVQALAVTDEGQIWFGTYFGEFGSVAPDQLLYKPDDYRLTMPSVRVIVAHPDGSIWVASLDGRIYRFVEDGDRPWLRYQQVLADAEVRDILIEDDTVWLGSDQGVVQFVGQICEMLPFRGEALDVLGGKIDADSGDLWWGTANQGAIQWDRTAEEFDWPVLHLRGLRLQAVGRTANEEVWFADDLNLYDIAGNGRQSVTLDPELVGVEGVTALALDERRRPWVGTEYGLFTPDRSGWRQMTAADGLASNHVLAIEMTADGTFWIVTDGGVSRYRP